MLDQNLADKSFNLKKIDKYHLSIQVSLNGVSFFVLDVLKKQFVVFKNYVFDRISDPENLVDKISGIFLTDKIITQPFKNQSLLYLSQKSTLVPAAFFNQTDLKKYFEFTQVLDDLDEIHYNYIKEIDAYNIFVIPSYVAGEIWKRFNKIKYYQQAQPLIKYALNYITESNFIYLNINKEFFDVIVKLNGKLILYNTFIYLNEHDLLYFVLYVSNQLKINITNTSVYLSGDCSQNAAFSDILNKYFLKVNLVNYINNSLAKSLLRILPYQYINLLMLNECV